ncbi:glyoxalase/Bleomycin resistance /Dioxygenase superfamily protein [Sphingomonas sp. S17]|jgi:catechol 2,3-dioxygenase-like lactoylglutathione lyase family enzyme|uniref:VOC family protein n=2 Tax=Sphingomonas paucimobilis TaxID=13689 RepID=A0A411LMM9_SPHPI|nr:MULTISPECIES: VOC family protein [Sphingomonas]EGI55193.1 glyoxalase/Bleomycin resistance /Dioxygenase superfamily protein [Sphingomonas sp. S17]MBQ1478421.1 VOC family protein [Sphingomonas sp.]MCM3679733.1 VOC family protein [Sphingomonas paucimobilis]MDG5970874.1 VOC family protein [Sphingomonas paucimobilis]NNG56859.1 VOC family protein [Sphingomonas paucimobilis]
MFSHVMLGANDIAEAKRFYDALLGVLGAPEGVVDPWGRLIYSHKGARFLLSKPINGEPATFANGGTLGFAVDSPEQADAWYAAGLAHGGTAIEDPPGIRTVPVGKVYLAYLRDPTGNKLCARHLVEAA